MSGVAALEGGQQIPPWLKRLGQRQAQAPLQAGLVADDGLLGLQQRLDAAAGVLIQPCPSVGQFCAAR